MHPSIPTQVLAQVDWALETLTQWNTAILQARTVEAFTRCPGRYEAEFRAGLAGRAQWTCVLQALAKLATFETLAAQQGIDAASVYARVGGKPVLLPESAEAQAWRT